MMKGVIHHIAPMEEGWTVFNSERPQERYYFENKDEAMAYAQARTLICEGHILLYQAQPETESAGVTLMCMSPAH